MLIKVISSEFFLFFSFSFKCEIIEGIGESRRVVRVLCEYISVQCSRPPPAHSKDLHSTIVAAYTCCASWLFAHPFLATDIECLHLILQVIELGISGSKSQVNKQACNFLANALLCFNLNLTEGIVGASLPMPISSLLFFPSLFSFFQPEKGKTREAPKYPVRQIQ